MKLKKGILINSLILAGFLLLLTTSCKKDETKADLASKITGTYVGTLVMTGTGTVPSSSVLSKNTETLVDILIVIGTSNIPLNGIEVSSSGNTYNLSYTDSSGSFTGKVVGNTLTWTLTSNGDNVTFSGTKN